MQCKDIPDKPILFFLAGLHRWATHWTGDGISMPSVADAMPPGTPEKLRLAKMGQLIKRNLVSGCTCGCRGDFEITAKGRELLSEQEKAK